MFNKTLRLLTKSKKHTKPLENMVNSLILTNGQISERMADNSLKITELETENKVLAVQRKSNRDCVVNLNSIIKGEC